MVDLDFMNKKFFPIIILILAFTGFISTQIIWDLFQVSADQSSEDSNKNLLYEANLKNTSFKTIDSKTMTFLEIKSPFIILNFWASWCLPCLKEFPGLVQLHKKFGDQLFIIGINGDEDKPENAIKKIQEKYRLDFPQVIDAKSEISDKFLLTAYPFTVIYFKGKVIYVSLKTMDFMSHEIIKLFEDKIKEEKK
jgi:thiol-disulfide isomerase/thioredoxin